MIRRGCLGALWSRWWSRVVEPADDEDAITRARRLAEAQLRRARARRPEIERVMSQAREHRVENHFAEMITEAFRRGEG